MKDKKTSPFFNFSAFCNSLTMASMMNFEPCWMIGGREGRGSSKIDDRPSTTNLMSKGLQVTLVCISFLHFFHF